MKIVRLLANLGYGSRKEVEKMVRDGRVRNRDGGLLSAKSIVEHENIFVDGGPLDPPSPLVLMMNKPLGYSCSHVAEENPIYNLLPHRLLKRKPALQSVGRLDKNTSGLLLFTDDGKLLHRLISPKHRVKKIYRVVLDRCLQGNEVDVFASGELMLRSEGVPCLPAELRVLSDKEVELTLTEGRYHQVRRMFAAIGNHVIELERIQVGELLLTDLAPGEWQILEKMDSLFINTTFSQEN